MDIEIDQMVDAACRRTGSDDFGEDTWRDALEVLVGSLTTEAALNDMGVAALTDQIVGNLVNRLQVEQWYAQHPEIDEQQIVAPLFGLGLPRTASTALGYLLAQDPARRSLRVWEASAPCPPPETSIEHTDARIGEAQAGIDFTNEMFPGFRGMLPAQADGPQECLLIMALDFRSQIFEGMAHIPTYSSWLLHCDMTSTYRYHRRVLKLLQWRCPPTSWSLRSPAHMHSIDALDTVYPDARFVMTHRDVGQVLPSVCALYDTFSSVLSERSDPVSIGAANVATWKLSLERLMAFRDAGNAARFHDLHFDDVQRDPIGTVSRLYHELGDDLSDVARRRMQNWWTTNDEARPPAHHHSPAKYGLDPSVLDEQFAFYHDRFAIPVSPH
jgi:hypothetical protein